VTVLVTVTVTVLGWLLDGWFRFEQGGWQMALTADDYRRLTRLDASAMNTKSRAEAARKMVEALEQLKGAEDGESLYDSYWLTHKLGNLLLEIGDTESATEWLMQSMDYWQQYKARSLV